MKNKAAQQLGRLGGKVSSEAKTAAVRKNGKKGGRPKLTLEERLERVLETGTPLRVTMPNGLRVRVSYVEGGYLRAMTVACQQRESTLIVEADNSAAVADELRTIGETL